ARPYPVEEELSDRDASGDGDTQDRRGQRADRRDPLPGERLHAGLGPRQGGELQAEPGAELGGVRQLVPDQLPGSPLGGDDRVEGDRDQGQREPEGRPARRELTHRRPFPPLVRPGAQPMPPAPAVPPSPSPTGYHCQPSGSARCHLGRSASGRTSSSGVGTRTSHGSPTGISSWPAPVRCLISSMIETYIGLEMSGGLPSPFHS